LQRCICYSNLQGEIAVIKIVPGQPNRGIPSKSELVDDAVLGMKNITDHDWVVASRRVSLEVLGAINPIVLKRRRFRECCRG
jgi:hypothetical protein